MVYLFDWFDVNVDYILLKIALALIPDLIINEELINAYYKFSSCRI